MPVATVSSGAFPAQVGKVGTFTSVDVQNPVCRGVKVVMDLTSNPGGLGSCVFKIQGRDPGSGNYCDLLTSAALTTVATRVFTVAPSITVSAGVSARDGKYPRDRLAAASVVAGSPVLLSRRLAGRAWLAEPGVTSSTDVP